MRPETEESSFWPKAEPFNPFKRTSWAQFDLRSLKIKTQPHNPQTNTLPNSQPFWSNRTQNKRGLYTPRAMNIRQITHAIQKVDLCRKKDQEKNHNALFEVVVFIRLSSELYNHDMTQVIRKIRFNACLWQLLLSVIRAQLCPFSLSLGWDVFVWHYERQHSLS